ncbi:VOC family protein [Streptomyces sp. NPDC058464]|uniref:VOC family protein n=1 Tax=Streptomyces sp. NPDC058464 TaxID=3346511 RepID=UPI00365E4408
MPGITQRSTKPPILKSTFISHGTLECRDIFATRRFYEEVLGLEVAQQASLALIVRLGGHHVYAVIETPDNDQEMPLLNHNGIDLGTREEVDEAHVKMQEIKDEYGIRKLTSPVLQHGTYSFYLQDLDGNWWEICYLPKNGFDFRFDSGVDLTGREDLSAAEIRSRLQRPLEHVTDRTYD